MFDILGAFPRARVALVTAMCVLSAAIQARADVNHQSIAVPLIGTSGVGSPYPSTITVTARGGPTQASAIRIILHAVTHPCPEDLAVLLVKNNTSKYLLMSHAGGCRPLQGTDVIFAAGNPALPDNDADPTPHGATLTIGASNYGAQPAFPAPAPAGPYSVGLPGTTVSGTWDLYVIDTANSNRGVIAAGWSFHYDTSPARAGRVRAGRFVSAFERASAWFLAEGATGPFFECFVLLSNPNSSTAHASITYLLPDGTTVPQTVDIPADGRVTVDVETVAPALANTPVSTIINSDLGIIVERSMYWPDLSLGWSEAHNSVGVIDAGLRWAVADGRIGGSRDHQTYILLANPNPVPAEVSVRFLSNGIAPVTRTYTLPPTSRTNIAAATDIPELAPSDSELHRTFSADIQVLNYQPIVVEKALYWNSGGQVWAAGTGTVGTPIPPPE